MYIIKMKTIIYYFAAFVISLTSIGLLRIYYTSAKPAAVTEAKADTVEVPILMYHSISKTETKGDYIITVDSFEEDLKFLTENGYTTIVMDDLINYTQGKTDLPEKPIVLTFDDGYFNNYAYAYPLLEKYNCRAVISVIGYYTELYSNSPDENPAYSHITWTDINKMKDSGLIEFQNHSYNLHTTDKGRNGAKKKRGEPLEQYKKKLTDDLQKLQDAFSTNTNYIPTTFTYPFGGVSEASFDIIKEMGFKASLSCENKTNHLSRDPEELFMLNRFIRTQKKSAQAILE